MQIKIDHTEQGFASQRAELLAIDPLASQFRFALKDVFRNKMLSLLSFQSLLIFSVYTCPFIIEGLDEDLPTCNQGIMTCKINFDVNLSIVSYDY